MLSKLCDISQQIVRIMFATNLWIPLIVVLWFYVIWSRRRLYKLMFQLPGPIGFPIIGSLYELWINNGFLDIVRKKIPIYGASFLGWFGPTPAYFVSDPQLVQELLNSPHALSKGQISNDVLREILGDGIIVLDDPVWSIHRKALNSAFSHNGLLSFIPIFNKEGRALLQELDLMVGKEETELLSRLKNFTLRIATQTTMGTDVAKEEVYQNETLMEKYNNLLDAAIVLILKPWYNIKWFRRWTYLEQILNDANSVIRPLIRKIIDKKQIEMSKNDQEEPKNNTFVNLAIDQLRKQVFNYQNVEEEAYTIVFAAFETTALTINYALMHLAMFPEYQERVFEEIKSVFPNIGHFDVSYDDLQKLEYLEMVINESMRVMPAIPLSLRNVTEDVKLSNGVTLPKGLQFCISIYHTHRNKEVWGPDADMFNPENCLPRNLRDKHPYALIPFLKGKRNCIGWKYGLLSLKITLAKILRNYKLSTSFRFEDLVLADNITLKVRQLPGLKLERRT